MSENTPFLRYRLEIYILYALSPREDVDLEGNPLLYVVVGSAIGVNLEATDRGLAELVEAGDIKVVPVVADHTVAAEPHVFGVARLCSGISVIIIG